MSPALNGTLGEYVAQRAKDHPTPLDAALFLTRTGTPVARHTHLLHHVGGSYSFPAGCNFENGLVTRFLST